MKLEVIKTAVETLKHGGIVALPTEGVYGLCCDPRQTAAIKRLCQIKERPENKGFVLVAAHIDQLQAYIQTPNPEQLKLLLETWPGPVTWIVPVKPQISTLIHGDEPTIAVRVTAHPIIAAICEQLGHPIISTSANKSTQSPAKSAKELDEIFTLNQIDYIIDAPLGELNGPTEIRDLKSRAIIRPFT